MKRGCQLNISHLNPLRLPFTSVRALFFIHSLPLVALKRSSILEESIEILKRPIMPFSLPPSLPFCHAAPGPWCDSAATLRFMSFIYP